MEPLARGRNAIRIDLCSGFVTRPELIARDRKKDPYEGEVGFRKRERLIRNAEGWYSSQTQGPVVVSLSLRFKNQKLAIKNMEAPAWAQPGVRQRPARPPVRLD